MEISNIVNAQNQLDKKMADIAESFGEEAIYDGIISPGDYVRTKRKILWLAREPHDDCGDYDYKSEIMKGLNAGNIKKDKYFDLMRYLLYSIENDYISWEDIPDSDTSEHITNLLKEVAFINCNKIPGGANVKWDKFWLYSEAFREIVFDQIKLAEPTVIICVGTKNYLDKYGYLDETIKSEKSYRNYYTKGNILILDCYHIAARISRQTYLDDIIKVLRENQ